jgi:hypothetical protein
LNTKEGGYQKARDSADRHFHSVSTNGSVDLNRRQKELDKRRKNEEDALNRKITAEQLVWRMERDLESKRRDLDQLRVSFILNLGHARSFVFNLFLSHWFHISCQKHSHFHTGLFLFVGDLVSTTQQ